MPKIHPRKVVIRKRPFTLLSRTMKQFDGLCDHPATPYPEIWIHAKLKGVEAFETLLHEGIHGGLPDLTEEAVTELAHDLTVMLWELGYRNEDWD
jgi:hypothetical protein